VTAIAQPGVTDIQPAQADVPPPAETTEEPPERRRRMAVLLLLAVLAVLLVAVVIWYLWFRQPITDILPDFLPTNPPAFQSAIYGLDKPLDVAVLADGSRMIVTQGGGDRATVMLDPLGNELASLVPPPTVAARSTQFYVAINPLNGETYATDRTNGSVFRYSSAGEYVGRFESSPSMGAWQPLGIAFDAAGNLYVTDAGGASQRVHVFGPDGVLLRDLGVDAGFNHPNGIAVDAAGNVYVADSTNGRLMVFDPTGAVLGVVPRGPQHGDLGMPRGVAIDAKGRVYVVDSSGQSVQMYRAIQAGDTAPLYLTTFGTEGSSDGAFEFPNGIAVDGRGRVYVADWDNDRVQIWSY
jgi:DNA-binding beta-propeller fold protein YncE